MNNALSHNSNRPAILLFLIGLFSQTQVHFMGSIGISELPIFLLAPIVFLKDYRALRNDGFLPFVWLSIMVCVACLISSVYNSTPTLRMMKGLATPYSIFAITIILHRLLRKDIMRIKWLFVGIFLSLIVSVFVFQPEALTVRGGDVARGSAAVESVISYPLFWAVRISALVALPIKCMYLRTPLAYSVAMTLGAGVFSILFSDSSGRATAMIALLGAVLLFLGGKSQQGMRRLSKNFVYVILIMGVVGYVGKVSYSYAAKNGILGYKAADKYEKQTSQGDSTLRLLMSGRKEFFIGLMAALDKPILGHGPAPEDTNGYYVEYLSKYGTPEEFEWAKYERIEMLKKGYAYYVIPTHSFLSSFWVYYGIVGLIFWINGLCMIWLYFRKYMAAIPQLFGYLAVFLPTMVWGTFFAPFGDRIGLTLPLVCILFVRAVYYKRIQLPYSMQVEVAKYNR